MELRQSLAVITGSTGRLGSAIAIALAEAGCHCICHYNKNHEKAKSIVEKIQSYKVKAEAIHAELTDEKQIENLFEKADRLGTVQILINSAAVFSRKNLKEVSLDEAQHVLNINLTAAILTSRYFAESINEKFPNSTSVAGKIINIADAGALRPWAGYVIYCSSKAGLIGATKALAKELAPAICVNAIAPGIVTWPEGFDEQQKQRQLSFIPVKRAARTEEITNAVKFLIENDYITGQVLCVDGGRSI
jgi:NAD(P)-dependent dehydrogenase (short-subunit alcohol dehydrogenase family)